MRMNTYKTLNIPNPPQITSQFILGFFLGFFVAIIFYLINNPPILPLIENENKSASALASLLAQDIGYDTCEFVTADVSPARATQFLPFYYTNHKIWIYKCASYSIIQGKRHKQVTFIEYDATEKLWRGMDSWASLEIDENFTKQKV